MEARIAWVLNLDADLELAAGAAYRPTKSVALAVKAHAARLAESLLGPRDLLVDGDTPALAAQGLSGRAFCPTPNALRLLERAGAVVEAHPGVDVLRRVNSRAFASSLGPTLAGAAFVTDLARALWLLAAEPPVGDAWRVKHAFGMAGRNQRVVRPVFESASDLGFVKAGVATGGVQIEPNVPIQDEYAVHGWIGQDGALHLGSLVRQRCNARGVWMATEPAPARAGPPGDLARRLQEEARGVAAALSQAGFFGPFGIDAYTYRDRRGALRLQPRSEINARYTMGFATGLGAHSDALRRRHEKVTAGRTKTSAICDEIGYRAIVNPEGAVTEVHALQLNRSPLVSDATSSSPPRSPSNQTEAGVSPTWSVEKSAELYQIRGWGEPYFRISESGCVEVRPDPSRDRAIDLFALAQELKARGLALPLLIRFSDILHDRIRRLNECFAKAIAEYGYQGVYRGVYPVKVNQQRHIVEEVVEFGAPWSYGLEAGSKPELLIALANAQESGGLILCNGYKDEKYIETALLAQRFDKTVFVVLERIEELAMILKASEKLGITPVIGVRAKLTAKGVGRWADSAGDRAKFGLTSSEIVEVVDKLAERNLLSSLQLLHFHIGSQVSSIIPIKNAMAEAANIFTDLAKMGANMHYLDVGGGLAVDYDGSKTDFHASKNYNVQEYANDVVASIMDACTKSNIPMPTIVTEAGRAVTAHQSVLVFEIVGTNEVRFGDPEEPKAGSHPVIRGLYDTWKSVVPKNVQEAFHDATQGKEEAQSLFKFGYLGLRDRAHAERMYWSCCEKILGHVRKMKYVPEELQNLERVLAAIYYCNFSIFQSAPDTWAIDQLFPILPIHRLEEEPTVRATLADLTCDSDGAIDNFIDREDVKKVLEVHPYRPSESYFMGLFLNGAYQEILGDLHNLFGDTNAVHVRLGEHEGYHVAHVVKGDSVAEVLHYVQYSPEDMVERVRGQAEKALRSNQITLQQMRLLMRHYEESLSKYTYLSDDEE